MQLLLFKGTAMYEKIEKEFPNLIIVPVNSQKEAFSYVEQKEADLTTFFNNFSIYNQRK